VSSDTVEESFITKLLEQIPNYIFSCSFSLDNNLVSHKKVIYIMSEGF
jgi:hypothetical protein